MTKPLAMALILSCASLGAQEAKVDRIVKAGQTLTLSEDLELGGADSLEIQGTPAARCTLVGNGHQIRSKGTWTGRLAISHCDIRGLGGGTAAAVEGRRTEAPHALDLQVSGQGKIAIDQSVFEESSSLNLRTEDQSTASFIGNVSRENSTVPMDKALEKSRPFFLASGSSTSPKLFQGNRIYRSSAKFEAPNWLVGGDKDEDGNVFIGLRTGIFAYGKGTVVRGNYTHCLMPKTPEFPYWSQVSTFTTARGALAEDNVIRDGEWIVQFVEGEFRNNVICDINDHNFLRNGSAGRIHHNIFVAGKPEHPPGSMSACIFVVYAPKGGEEGVEIFNNTFDAGGTMNVPGVEVSSGGWVKSVRNNVFYNFMHREKYVSHAQAMIRPAWTEPLSDPAPVRLGYSDYNLFYSPSARVHRNYALGVQGKVERKDAGFGLNDLPRGGAPNEQVDPKFKGPITEKFAFDDVDIKSGKVTVSKMLAHYREVYTPAPGSPLIGAGDPADGEGSSIGAIEPGKRK